jgi:hypothetical protein
MRNLSAGHAGAAFASMLPAHADLPRPEHISKLVLNCPKDRHLIEAVGGYPARLQSCVLTAWLRGGWRLSRARPGPLQPIPPPVPPPLAPTTARVTRRIRFDDPADPALAGFLRSLPRKERGREIRNFISVALRSGARQAP